MSHHKEIAFEEDICTHLGAHGWHYAPNDAQHHAMRQAIAEGFILNVLKNYTPYKLAFRLAMLGRE